MGGKTLNYLNMKNTKEVWIPGMTGTTLMTLFSYAASHSEDENFKEPVLLAGLIENLGLTKHKQVAAASGWAMHYVVGLVLAGAFQKGRCSLGVRPSLGNGAVFGLLAGIGGACIWKLVFSLHPNPPRTSFGKYYKQLLLAHVVFGLGVALTSKKGA